MAKITNILSNTLTLILKTYQYCLSPLLGNRCRFYPSCSSYAIDAIGIHGSLLGCSLTFKRVLRCHPWHPGGVDFVPEKKPNAN